MFPPSSPLMERVRVQSELEELERKAIWNAHFRSERRFRLPKLSFFRRSKAAQPKPATTATGEWAKVEG